MRSVRACGVRAHSGARVIDVVCDPARVKPVRHSCVHGRHGFAGPDDVAFLANHVVPKWVDSGLIAALVPSDFTNIAVVAVYPQLAAGWLIMVAASFNIHHCSFVGLRKVWNAVAGRPEKAIRFTVRFLFSIVRHPISLGRLIVFRATPATFIGHLLLVVCVSVYIALVTPTEEAGLASEFGEECLKYKKRVRANLSWPRRG